MHSRSVSGCWVYQYEGPNVSVTRCLQLAIPASEELHRCLSSNDLTVTISGFPHLKRRRKRESDISFAYDIISNFVERLVNASRFALGGKNQTGTFQTPRKGGQNVLPVGLS